MTPQDEDAVRRLLADARHSDPIPDDVAARLDRALADLADLDVEAGRPAATVTPLAQRRRNASRLLVAAAAVVLVGVGVGQVLDGTSGGADSESATAGDARTYAEDGAAGTEAAEEEPAEAAGVPESERDDLRRQGIARLRSQSFTDDVTELNAEYLASSPAPSGETGSDGQGATLPEALDAPLLDGAGAAALTCGADAWGRGRFVAVRYDGLPAVLVFRKASGDTQVADLFLCGSTTPERSVTLPAP